MSIVMHQKPNRLIHEKSPYILQHAYNPVDWFSWEKRHLIKLRKKESLYFYRLNIFLTPDKEPFYAGTYFPKNDRYDRPELISVLKSISKAWDDKSAGFFLNAMIVKN